MHPVVHERCLPGRGFGEGDLGLVVREDQVDAAPVDVVARSEQAGRDGGVLDVPARAPGAPGAVPLRLPGGRGLPDHEIFRARLRGSASSRAPGTERLDLLAGEAAVGGVLGDGVVHRAVVGGVGHSLLDERPDLLDDLGDEIRRVRIVVDRTDPEPLHGSEVGKEVAVGEAEGVLLLFSRPGDDLVVEVRHVLDVEHAIAPAAKGAGDGVEDDERAAVPHVRLRVGRQTADEQPDPWRDPRREDPWGAGHRIVDRHPAHVRSPGGRYARRRRGPRGPRPRTRAERDRPSPRGPPAPSSERSRGSSTPGGRPATRRPRGFRPA